MLYLTSTSETVAQLRQRDYNLSVKVQRTTVAQKERTAICYNVPRENLAYGPEQVWARKHMTPWRHNLK